MDKILVSVVCVSYNHQDYIELAINSVLNQITKFDYEVLVGEDCSTDNTREVLKSIEKRNPGKLKIFYRDNNYGPTKNFMDLYYRCQGKYIIVLETDDFWIDNYKLQKQVDFLESNNDYLGVAHWSIIVDKNNNCLGISYPECKKREYTLKDFKNGIFPGQTTTLMYRNYYTRNVPYNTDLTTGKEYDLGPGDARRAFMLVANGKVGVIPEKCSAYRLVRMGGSSFTATQIKDINKTISYRKCFVKYAKDAHLSKEALYVAEYMLLRDCIYYWLHNINTYSLENVFSILRSVKSPAATLMSVIAYLIRSIVGKPFGINKTYKKSNISEDVVLIQSYIIGNQSNE